MWWLVLGAAVGYVLYTSGQDERQFEAARERLDESVDTTDLSEFEDL